MMNAPQSLSVTQIPQGIAAQVGPAPPPGHPTNQNQPPQQHQPVMTQQQQFSHSPQQFTPNHQQQGGVSPPQQQGGPAQFGYAPQQPGANQYYGEGVVQYAQHNG